MNNTITIESLSKKDTVDTMAFDTADTSTIDMTEIINFDKQTKVTKVVSGVENYLSNGVLNGVTALYLGVKTSNNKMDPAGSIYNDRFGGEGFFETTLNGLKAGILAVIRFVKKILLWIVDKVKTLFGFTPSERQASAIQEKMPEMRETINKYMMAIGFPAQKFDLSEFLADMPNDRWNGQIKYMTTKLGDKGVYMQRFAEIPPAIQEVCRVISKGAGGAKNSYARFKKHLNFLVNTTKHTTVDWESEITKLSEIMLEVVRNINYREVVPALNKLNEIIIGDKLEIPDDLNQFNAEAIKLSELVTQSITYATEAVDKPFVKSIEQVIALNNVNNFEKLNADGKIFGEAMKDLYLYADADDLNKIHALSALSGRKELIGFYKEMIGAVNVFTDFARVNVDYLRLANKTFNDLCDWYRKANLLMLSYYAEDIKTITAIFNKAKATWNGQDPFPLNLGASGVPNIVAIPEADIQTFFEGAGDLSVQLIEANILNIKNVMNNFSKSIGGGNVL